MKIIDINKKKKPPDQVTVFASLITQDIASKLNSISDENSRNELAAVILLYSIECMKNGSMSEDQVFKIIDIGLKRSFPE
jgi:hypothetical protein